MKTLGVSNRARWISVVISFFLIFSGGIVFLYWIIVQKMQLTWHFWKSGLSYALVLFFLAGLIITLFGLCKYRNTQLKQNLKRWRGEDHG